MLAGESAGAVAVLLHLALPASGPGTIIQSAAVHSAPCVAAPHRFECVSSLETMQRTVADPLAAAAGCTRAATSEPPGLDEQVCRKRLVSLFPLVELIATKHDHLP
jgi:carboxylesterase type B